MVGPENTIRRIVQPKTKHAQSVTRLAISRSSAGVVAAVVVLGKVNRNPEDEAGPNHRRVEALE